MKNFNGVDATEIARTTSAKELREEAKLRNIPGRWDMNKSQLLKAVIAYDEEQAKKVETKKATKKEKKAAKKAIKVQREFVKVGDDRGKEFGYISLSVKSLDKEQAEEYAEQLVEKMNEMYDFGTNGEEASFHLLKCPDTDEGYTDTISFIKDKGHIAEQRLYVGKLMTEAMKAMMK